MPEEALFAILAFLCIGGSIADILFGPEMQHRGAFQVLLVVLYAGMLFTIPSCSSIQMHSDEHPEVYEKPY